MAKAEKKEDLRIKIKSVGEDLQTIYSDMRDLRDKEEIGKKVREEKLLLNKLKNLELELKEL